MEEKTLDGGEWEHVEWDAVLREGALCELLGMLVLSEEQAGLRGPWRLPARRPAQAQPRLAPIAHRRATLPWTCPGLVDIANPRK